MNERNTILVAEDSQEDMLLIRRAFNREDGEYTLQVVYDGAEAMDYLMGSGRFQDRNYFPFPRLVITDLKMPKVTGLEMMATLRQNNSFPDLPVVVLTTSREDVDKLKCKELGCSDFLNKDILLDTPRLLIDKVRQLAPL